MISSTRRSPAADADQKAVAADEDQSAHAEDVADHTGDDALAAAAKTQENHDASAVQTHDPLVASAVHDGIVNRSQAIESSLQASAAQSVLDVQAAVAPLPTAVPNAVNAKVSDYQSQNADYTARSISLAAAQRAALLNQVQNQANANNAAAQQQLTADQNLPLTAQRVLQQNPSPPQSGYQTFLDYMPSWQTIGTIALVAEQKREQKRGRNRKGVGS